MATEFDDVLTNQPVVIDNGSGTVKAGFAGQDRPNVFSLRVSVAPNTHERWQAPWRATGSLGVKRKSYGDCCG